MSLKLGLRNKIRRSRSAGAGFTGLLDQSFATGATAAYSLRQLKSTATKAVRVREDSGNTETDIGFSGGTLDTTALLNHVGSNNGFVTKWYDQSGNGNDASNSSASEQPQIVDSGSIITENGKPAISYDGSDDTLVVNNKVIDDTAATFLLVATINNIATPDAQDFFGNGENLVNSGFLYDLGGPNNDKFQVVNNDPAVDTVIRYADAITGQAYHFVINTVSDSFLYLNNSKLNSTTNDDLNASNNTQFFIGSRNGNSKFFGGNMQEILLYESAKSANRGKFRNNVNGHYSIF